ncbi:hypothetical protein N8216_01570, partial [Flavobacteriaceae bacterium]|nr:hypothetical protein [Flavobacteriaceae bacterium]
MKRFYSSEFHKSQLFFVVCTLLMLLSANLSAQIHVDKTAMGSNSGTSWTDAYTDLQAAIDAASIGDEIWVAAGTYLPTDAPDGTTSSGATDRNNAFHLNKNLKIYGGFIGTETMLSERDWEANATLLSGDFMDDDMVIGSGSTLSITSNAENAYHVFITSSLDSTSLIDGFTVQGGNANGSFSISYDGSDFSQTFGGGMYHINSSPGIRNSTFSRNAGGFGGGMYSAFSSSPSISNSSFSGNLVFRNGAGMLNTNSSPSISNTSFSGNSAGSLGGGILSSNSSLSITNSIFSGNSASNLGGAMYNDNSSLPSISNTTFSRNSATNNGGGIYNDNSSSSIINNTVFYGNTAPTGFDIFGAINNTSSYNASDGSGGGIGSGTGFIDLSLSGVTSSTLFVNASDPEGPDGIWRTADDGLIPVVGSDLIDMGNNDRLPPDTTDLDGDGNTSEDIPYDSTGAARIFDGTVDVGAYEVVPLCSRVNRLYVNHAAMGNNTGESWVNAFTNLQGAMDCATAGKEIWVAAGTYLPTDAPDENTAVPKDRAFHLNKNLKIYGGFVGTETMLSERDWEANATFLSGDFMDDDMVIGSGSTLSITNNTENAYHVFITFGLDSTTLIDGFTV